MRIGVVVTRVSPRARDRIERARVAGDDVLVVAPPSIAAALGVGAHWPRRGGADSDLVCAPIPDLLPSAAARAALNELHREAPFEELWFAAADATAWLPGIGSRQAGELPGARIVIELEADDGELARPLAPGDPLPLGFVRAAARAALADADAVVGDLGARARLEAAGFVLAAPRLRPAWEPGAKRVSIVIAQKDMADYLAATVASARAQTVPCEIVIVDDGSSAAGLAAVDAEVTRDPTIKVIRQPNGGPGRARNVGARAASGELILFLDGDDLLHPTCAAELAEALRWRPAHHVAVPVSRLFDDATGATVRYYHPIDQSVASLMFICRVGLSCAMHRRDAFLAVEFTEDRDFAIEDWDLWLRYLERGFLGRVVVPSLLFEYRQRTGSRRGYSATEMVYELALRYAHHPSLLAGSAAEVCVYQKTLKNWLLQPPGLLPAELMTAVLGDPLT